MKRFVLTMATALLSAAAIAQPAAPVTAIRAGRLLDAEAGRILTNGVMTPAAFFHGGPVNGWRIR
jgi:hypothetical protein